MVAFSSLLKAVERLVFLRFLYQVSQFLKKNGVQGLVKLVISRATMLPGVKGVISEQLSKEVDKLEEKMLGKGDERANMELPKSGRSREEILLEANKLHREDDFGTGKKWAGIYHDITGDSTLDHLQAEMWTLFNNSNGLYPGIFKSCRKFEAEIVQMCVSLLKGGEDACGLLTSGGTESILLAILGYRELARSRGIMNPEVICCVNAHPALDKACHYFGLTLRKAQACPKKFILRPEDVISMCGPETIAIYASAPCFPHGTVDPIEELAAIAKKRNIGLHVDNCLGGFYLSGLQATGMFKRKFNFEVDGVTSISIDIHKYGYAPKGASVVAFSTNELRRLTIHPVTDGLTLYVTPTLQGSRGGGVIASAWATMMYYGADGYVTASTKLHQLKSKVEKAIENMPGIQVGADADLAVIPIVSDKFDIYSLATLMEKRGWSVFTSQNPPMMQLCYGEQHFRVIDSWLKDLGECAKYLGENPNVEVVGEAAVYGAAKVLPDEILGDVLKSYIEVKMKVKPMKA